MNGLIAQALFIARFLCFMSVLYLALHNIVYRLNRRPESKLLWFFGVLTAPLIRPIRLWLIPGASDGRLLRSALLIYALLWLIIIALERVYALIST